VRSKAASLPCRLAFAQFYLFLRALYAFSQRFPGCGFGSRPAVHASPIMNCAGSINQHRHRLKRKDENARPFASFQS
jgi:hypothetical protein